MDEEISTKLNALECMLIDGSAEAMDLPLSLLKDITNNFTDDHIIGSGGCAVVYKGMVGNEIVAVKRLSRTLDMHESKFHKEVECLMKAKHKNIVRFLGYCSDTQGKIADYEGKMVMADIRNWLLCFEYVPNGSLDNYIADASHGPEWKERYQIIKGICEGLCHLHEKRILHLDLKPANILIDDHMVPKIADFGLSRCLDKEQTRVFTSNLYGSLGYLAPEFYSGHIAFASDIYSLGIIIMEILTGQKGYSEADNVIDSWMIQLETSDQADTLLEQVRVCTKIGIECMNLDPKKRPVARHIVDMLDETESVVYSDKTATSSSSHNLLTSPAHSGGDAAPAARGGVQERSTEWWDRLNSPVCPDTEFRRAFRMSRATFDALCDELSAAVVKNTSLPTAAAAIPVHQRVALGLETEEQRNKSLVLRLYEALNSCDHAAVHSLLAPDLEWWFHGPPAHQHMMRVLTGGTSPSPSFRFQPRTVDAFGSTVIAEGKGEAKAAYWVHAWTVGADGVITQLREYFNTDLTVAAASKCVWQSRRPDRKQNSLPGLVLALKPARPKPSWTDLRMG